MFVMKKLQNSEKNFGLGSCCRHKKKM